MALILFARTTVRHMLKDKFWQGGDDLALESDSLDDRRNIEQLVVIDLHARLGDRADWRIPVIRAGRGIHLADERCQNAHCASYGLTLGLKSGIRERARKMTPTAIKEYDQ